MSRFNVFHEMAKSAADDPEFVKKFDKIADESLKKMGKTWEQLFEQPSNNRVIASAMPVWVIMAYDGASHTWDRLGISNSKAEAMAYARQAAIGSITTFVTEGYSQ